MSERVFPSKPTTTNATNGTTAAPPQTNGTANPAFPANKSQLYKAYRRRRSRCCSCFLWTTLILIILIILAAITAGVLYVLYRPHRPSFTVSSLQISQFNLTSSSKLYSNFNLTLTARNPNKKITFYYNPIAVKFTSDGVIVGNGSFPAFTHATKNTTVLRSVISRNGDDVDGKSLNLKNTKSLPLKIQLDTKVKVKIGGMKTKKVGIRVTCTGIKATVPTGKSPAVATTAGAKCKADLRIKIWKFTL